MPITCTENIDSRQYTEDQSAELVYTVRGTADETTALSSLKATAPGAFRGLAAGECLFLGASHRVRGAAPMRTAT